MSGFSMSLDVEQFEKILASDEAAINECLRPAAQAGVQILYEAVQRNVAALGRKSGNLAASIYQAYSKKNSGEDRATYHVSWRTGSERDEYGERIMSGLPTAPHGHLVEWGYLQRYVVYQGSDGGIHTMVRPGMRGAKRPTRHDSQAVKDAYFVTRPGGPVHVPGKAFVRRAADQFPQALSATERELFKRLKSAGVIT